MHFAVSQVPRPLLLLFKTNDCLRHAERQLVPTGAGADSFLVTLRYCLRCLRHEARAAAAAAAASAGAAGSSTGRSAAGGLSRRWLGVARAWLTVLRLDVAVWLLRVFSGSALLPRAVRALSLSPASAKQQQPQASESTSTSAVSVEHT